MTVVVDASVLVAVLVGSGREGRWAETAISGDDAAGPELALAEASNTLRRLERTGALSRPQATNIHGDLARFDMALFPFAPFAARVWALRDNLTSYYLRKIWSQDDCGGASLLVRARESDK